MAQQSQVQLGEKTQRFGSESKSKRQETGWRQRKGERVIIEISLVGSELLHGKMCKGYMCFLVGNRWDPSIRTI